MSASLTPDLLARAKSLGFSDRQIAELRKALPDCEIKRASETP